jgi:hypothetical protein
MSATKRRKKRKTPSDYEPEPKLPPQLEERYALVLAALSGVIKVEHAARRARLSRPRFQTLMHRAQSGLIESLVPKPPGRPPRSAREVELEQQVQKLSRQNERLQERVDTIDRLLGVASDMLTGRLEINKPRSKRRKRTTASESEPESEDPDPAQGQLAGAQEMRQLGLKPQLAAAVVGAGASTLRRWNARARAGQPLRERRGRPQRRRPPPEACAKVEAIVRELEGLCGAQSLRRSVPGVSRRQAAELKQETLVAMERERKAACDRVEVLVPGVVRGFDAMCPRGEDHEQHLLIAADAAVCFRTSIEPYLRYNSPAVAELLERDFDEHGAPLVLRLDRARMHRTDLVLELLRSHQVLLLHGPPYHAQYYGQLERQNREHRAWLTAAGVADEDLPEASARMKHALNAVWRRPTLGWLTAEEVWQKRPPLRIVRAELRDRVADRKARLRRHDAFRNEADDVVARFAIEQELIKRRLMSLLPGGNC